jgi:DNA-binding GntR family transcriptional regulator
MRKTSLPASKPRRPPRRGGAAADAAASHATPAPRGDAGAALPGGSGLTLNEEAYRRLEELIVTLQLAPGSVVSEASLSKLLGIGTTPIREALQRLSREHLVQILPRRGVVVTQIDLRQQLQVLETRRELDRLIARLAARRATPAERQRMATIARQMARAVNAGAVRDFLQCDAELNTVAALAARNEIAARTVASLHAASRRFWFFHQALWPGTQRTMQLHVAFAEALASGVEAASASASDALIDDLDSFARSTVAP